MSEEIKRLYRSRIDRQLAGVCGGLGEHFGIDPVLVRLLWIVGTLATGGVPGLICYLAAWFLVPQRPLPARTGYRVEPTHEEPA